MGKALRETFHQLPTPVQDGVRAAYPRVSRIGTALMTAIHKCGYTRFNLWRNGGKSHRRLEIGPGPERIDGFETLNIIGARNVDYVGDAAKRMPFADDTFECIYASHILEHVPWYKTEEALREWVRVLQPGGTLEVWVPDGLKIAAAFVDAETSGGTDFRNDGWYKFNEQEDPCLWMAGRMYSYGAGDGNRNDPNWHMAVFSPRHLQTLFENAGLENVERLDPSAVRGYDHGWINLGMTGRKPS